MTEPSFTKDEGSRVVFLGTGGGPVPVGRASISTALVVCDPRSDPPRERIYLVDCGRGALAQYLAADLRLSSLAGIFLTHLHADHTSDYYNFFLLGGGRRGGEDGIFSAVNVLGPGPAGALPPPRDPSQAVPTVNPDNPTPGLADLTAKQIEAFAYHTNLLIRLAGGLDVRTLLRVHQIVEADPYGSTAPSREPFPFPVMSIEIPDVGADPLGPTAPPMEPFPVMADGLVTVSAILVPHGPVFPSLAFRFDTPDGSVVFSGDTIASDNVVRLARGAEVLVHEVMDVESILGPNPSPAAVSNLRAAHTDVSDVGGIAQRAGVSVLMLTHFAPSDPAVVSDDSWRQRAQVGYDGQVIVGRDLKQVTLPRW